MRVLTVPLLATSALLAAGLAASDEEPLLAGIRQLTFEGARAGEGYFNADGSRMVFQSERDPANPFYQIYLMDLETGDVERVSPGVGKTTCAWVHPDNGRVLYSSTHEDPTASAKMRAELEFRSSGQERRYSWDYDEQFEIYEHDLITGRQRNLTNALGYDAEGSYSPDGGRIVFASNRRAYGGEMSPAEAKVFEHDPSYMMDLYLMNADGGDVQQLTDTPGYDGGPFFSPDGRRITWRRFSADGATAEIYVMDLEDRVEKRLTNTGVMSWAPYFHPSGDYLIYAANAEGFSNFELYLVDAEGRHAPVRVTHTDGFDGLPVFSPDGEQLAWTSNRTADGKSQIFLARWDDPAARRLLGLDGQAGEAGALGMVPGDSSTAITSADARRHLERLTADDMDGRLTGTPGERLATDYVAGVFKHLGLEPGGDEETYFQAFSFTAGASLSHSNRLRVSGTGWAADAELDSSWRPLALSRNGETEGEVVFVGYGIVAPAAGDQPGYDAYGDQDVAGKWVLMFRYQPESVSPERRRHLLFHSGLAYKASWARRKGALGMIVVTGPTAQANSELVPLRMDATTPSSSIAGISVSNALAGQMLAAADEDLAELQARLDDGETTATFPLPGLRVDAGIDVVRERRQGRNVIGVLRADSPVGPPVVFGAHVDHLGRGQVSGSLARDDEVGQIHRGADDNASGVAGLLEAAEYLAGERATGRLGAQRDIVFVAWSGEELGTLGSTHFVEQLAGTGDLHGKVSAYLNMDMIGRFEDKVYLQGTGSSEHWAREIERRNIPVGLPITTSADPYLPTDSTPFYMKGVPVLAAFTGVHEEYSTPRDTPDRINYEGLRDVSRLMAGIARSLARDPSEPDYQEVTRTDQGGRSSFRVYLGTIPSYGEEEGLVGVRLQGAVKGSPAEQAGVQGGDVLVRLAGVDIENIYDFMTALAGLRAGEKTDMTVERDGAEVVLEVVPGSRD